jgi:DNA-binding transcriptional ArsR family regulator
MDIFAYPRTDLPDEAMPERALVTRELSQLLGVLSHPLRIRIVQELRDGEHDVTYLQGLLGISHAGVSQHLGLLRAHRIVVERREGRHVYYHLRQPELAAWLVVGLRFVETDRESHEQFIAAIEHVRAMWPEKLGSP